MNNTAYVCILVAVSAIVTIALRAFPFVIFNGRRQMPQAVKRVADSLPPAIMGVLVVYCLKDNIVTLNGTSVAAFISVLFVAIVHIWKKNTLLSIALGTVLYMFLIKMQ